MEDFHEVGTAIIFRMSSAQPLAPLTCNQERNECAQGQEEIQQLVLAQTAHQPDPPSATA